MKRRDMYATQSSMLLHLSQFYRIYCNFCLNINKKKILNINTKYSYQHQLILPFLFLFTLFFTFIHQQDQIFCSINYCF